MKALTEVQTSFKATLEKIGKATKKQWHSQDVMAMASCITLLDLAEIKDQAKRDEILAKWNAKCAELPGLGANGSQLGQKLGREKAVDVLSEALKGF